ncbi:MAG: thioredoxin family protein [Chitinophagaceae bacterium]
MRKTFSISILLLAYSVFAFAQDSSSSTSPYIWKAAAKKNGEGNYELSFTTNSSNGWQLYAPNQLLNETKVAELIFADSNIMQQGPFVETGDIQTINSTIFDNTKIQVYEKQSEWKATIHINGQVPAQLRGTLNYTYGKGDEFYPSTPFAFSVALEGGIASSTKIKVASIDINKPFSGCGDEGTAKKSILTVFLLGFLGGLIALLTPCVFPMIPVTVTFFTKKSQSSGKGITNAVLYGLFIFLIYILITIPFHVANKAISPEIFNNISTNVWLNLTFFAIFILFALSFFGLYEIGLPSGLANKMDSRSGLGNIGGIFFMAATLAIVSFSCTGPILGTLLVGVADQGAWPLTAGAAGFGLALGLPFALFAMFPNWLHSLPKSGGWMTDVKVVLGFVEIALAVKFLSNADLVKQWGFVKRETFIALWIIVGALTSLYLLGFLKIGHSSPVRKYSFTRIAFIVLFAAFTIYLIPGVTNTKAANLKLISGFPPPLGYSLYSNPVNYKKGFKPLENNYTEALEKARRENKPVLIDFTGWACVNCRKMEESVWTDPDVDSLMKKEFVVVSLYVDERKNLPLAEQTTITTSTGKEKEIVTVGDKWATFQTENFGATSQPQYAIISADQIALTKTKYYTPNPKEFSQWLQCGLETYRKGKN